MKRKICTTFTSIAISTMLIASPVLASSYNDLNYAIDMNVQNYDYYSNELIDKNQNANQIEDFDFANAMATLDLQHAIELISDYITNNPNATDQQINAHLKELILNNSIKTDNTQTIHASSGLPYNINRMGPNTTAVFNTNPVLGSQALLSGDHAERTTSNRWSSGFTNGNADAFRHTYWNGHMIVAGINRNFVERFATAWEDDGDRAGQIPLARQMDLFNNSIGVQIGLNLVGRPDNTRLQNDVMNDVRNGRTRRFNANNSALIATNGDGAR